MILVHLTWTCDSSPASFAVHYEITGSSPGRVNTIISGSQRSYIISVPSGSKIHFEIKAVGSNGVSSESAAADFTAQ